MAKVGETVERLYTVLYEQGDHGWGAYVPDLPGCVTAGKTREEVERQIREAIELHLEGMIEEGLAIPEPTVFPAQISLSVPIPITEERKSA